MIYFSLVLVIGTVTLVGQTAGPYCRPTRPYQVLVLGLVPGTGTSIGPTVDCYQYTSNQVLPGRTYLDLVPGITPGEYSYQYQYQYWDWDALVGPSYIQLLVIDQYLCW